MNSKERIAYLRGLLDFVPREEKEAKIYSAIVDALDALAQEMEDQAKLLEIQREDCDNLADEMDDLHDVVYELEESLGVDDSDENEDGYEEPAESYISVTCPACAYLFYYKYEEGKEEGKLICPSCGEEFSR